jgi:hypothetical protein
VKWFLSGIKRLEKSKSYLGQSHLTIARILPLIAYFRLPEFNERWGTCEPAKP